MLVCLRACVLVRIFVCVLVLVLVLVLVALVLSQPGQNKLTLPPEWESG